eukprot:tig00000711_g3390.t1
MRTRSGRELSPPEFSSSSSRAQPCISKRRRMREDEEPAPPPREWNVLDSIYKSQLGLRAGRGAQRFSRGIHARQVERTIAPEKVPGTLSEREYSKLMKSNDKVFAAIWLDDTETLHGTKNNKLCRINVETQAMFDVPMIKYDVDRPYAGPPDNCGIHSIAVNPSRTLLATGGYDPQDIALYSLPSMQPVAVLEGHTDWMFAAGWVDDWTLVSASRDKTVRLWKMDTQQPAKNPKLDREGCYVQLPVVNPYISCNEHQNKVRDLRINKLTSQAATISSDSKMLVWDVQEMRVARAFDMQFPLEAVCVAAQEERGLFVIGSRGQLEFIDPRAPKSVQTRDSQDDGQGVRSLSFREHVMTVGGGGGRISFFDIRANRFMELLARDGTPARFLNAGPGVLANWYDRSQHQNAIYAHQYDQSGTRLLTAGGPLPFGVRGCYVAVW